MIPKVILNRHIDSFKRRKSLYKELFDLDFWKTQDSYKLIKKYCAKDDIIIEIGCLTAHHLILLCLEDYKHLIGYEYNKEAIEWADGKIRELDIDGKITLLNKEFPTQSIILSDKIILFDVIEHVPNLQSFFEGIDKCLSIQGEVLILVPKGKEFYDEGHINFFPDEECLYNHLSIYFHIVELFSIEDGKIFARCKKKL